MTTDFNGIKSRACYNAYNNLIEIREDLEGKNINTTYSYLDPNGNYNGLLHSEADSNSYSTKYYYDKTGRIIGIDYPDVDNNNNCGAPWNTYKCDVGYVYNADFSYQRIDANGQIKKYVYDNLGRIITKDYGNDRKITYDYMLENGKYSQMLRKVIDSTLTPSRTTEFTYDEFYRLSTKKVKEEETQQYSISYSYNFPGNNLSSYQIDTDPPVAYEYYPDGSTKNILKGDIVINYAYLLNGSIDKIRYPFSSVIAAVENTYDSHGRLTEINNRKNDGSILSRYNYIYDFVDEPTYEAKFKGYRTGMLEYVQDGLIPPSTNTEKYYYDSLYQIAKTEYPDLQTTYTWDYDDLG